MYPTFRERLIHLHHCRGIGWKSISLLLRSDPSLSSIFHLSYDTFCRLLPLPKQKIASFFQDLHSIELKSMIKTYDEQKVHIVTIIDKHYPYWLKHIYDPPWVLYAKGKMEHLQNLKMISVVGTRMPTEEGIVSLRKLLLPLLENEWVIVSGLAKGIDTEAHRLCLQHNGNTIAVIAGGFQHIYPRENHFLSRQLMTNQLIISEFPPYVRPQKWHFPLRNRIISGLSVGTVVVQARERSGSLITADLALQQGREVFAVPSSIVTNHSVGTNRLIQQGAKLVITSEDIEEEFRHIFS
ncbi:DNA processing protein [Thermolongibacillus altinsuensis]|jgi:DNA processing protein|uniref:DNA processing protein n=1 Tax=Thermolongibacillus altinsuensis TaxID=575256 RepID=A0A4R1QMZ8_9BACL|nr:DNA-processing protein DprA [Thermolongibacillus altinsuensis]TCL50359.1 DNA processing protein [Thermolongibacillus altinsuensis]GMB08473.1 DNA processing protein DprA [Thermolongibacillus altinsuensis]